MGYDNYKIVIDNATESVMKDFGDGTRQSIASVWNMDTLNTRDRAAAEAAIQQNAAEKAAEDAAKEPLPTTRAFKGGVEVDQHDRPIEPQETLEL